MLELEPAELSAKARLLQTITYEELFEFGWDDEAQAGYIHDARCVSVSVGRMLQLSV